jgi:hypothetical protein
MSLQKNTVFNEERVLSIHGYPRCHMTVTILQTLSKQSRQKGSFHSISETGTSPITLTCTLMDLVEDPTFFKKSSIACVGNTKHCTQENSFWISGSDEVHRFLLPHSVHGITKGVQRTDTMMMFTMGWWLTVVHPSLKTTAATSSTISLILPM